MRRIKISIPAVRFLRWMLRLAPGAMWAISRWEKEASPPEPASKKAWILWETSLSQESSTQRPGAASRPCRTPGWLLLPDWPAVSPGESWKPALQFHPAFQSPAAVSSRQYIPGLPHRNAAGNPADFDACGLDQLAQVHGCGLPPAAELWWR